VSPTLLQNAVNVGPKWLTGGFLERLGLLEVSSASGLQACKDKDSWTGERIMPRRQMPLAIRGRLLMKAQLATLLQKPVICVFLSFDCFLSNSDPIFTSVSFRIMLRDVIFALVALWAVFVPLPERCDHEIWGRVCWKKHP